MCSAYLLVNLFTKDFAYELQIYKKTCQLASMVCFAVGT